MRFILMAIFLFTCPAYAVDNPDAPDYVGDFEKRIAPYYTSINGANSTYDYVADYVALQNALEMELDDAYRLLLETLPEDQRPLLVSSQEQWKKYRDAENELIGSVWTQESYGTSSSLTRGGLRCSILRSRAVGSLGKHVAARSSRHIRVSRVSRLEITAYLPVDDYSAST